MAADQLDSGPARRIVIEHTEIRNSGAIIGRADQRRSLRSFPPTSRGGFFARIVVEPQSPRSSCNRAMPLVGKQR